MASSSDSTLKYSFPLIFLGAVMVSIGFFALFAYGQFTTITCTNMEDGRVDCVKETSWYNLWPVSQAEVLPDIIRSRVEISCSSGGGSSRYQCYSNVLVVENEEKSFEIGSPYFNETTAAKTSASINAYILQPSNIPLFIDCKSIPFAILGSIFVAMPFLILGGAAWWVGYFRRPIKWLVWH